MRWEESNKVICTSVRGVVTSTLPLSVIPEVSTDRDQGRESVWTLGYLFILHDSRNYRKHISRDPYGLYPSQERWYQKRLTLPTILFRSLWLFKELNLTQTFELLSRPPLRIFTFSQTIQTVRLSSVHTDQGLQLKVYTHYSPFPRASGFTSLYLGPELRHPVLKSSTRTLGPSGSFHGSSNLYPHTTTSTRAHV